MAADIVPPRPASANHCMVPCAQDSHRFTVTQPLPAPQPLAGRGTRLMRRTSGAAGSRPDPPDPVQHRPVKPSAAAPMRPPPSPKPSPRHGNPASFDSEDPSAVRQPLIDQLRHHPARFRRRVPPEAGGDHRLPAPLKPVRPASGSRTAHPSPGLPDTPPPTASGWALEPPNSVARCDGNGAGVAGGVSIRGSCKSVMGASCRVH